MPDPQVPNQYKKRVRTGCLTCRSRKKKCGEEHPCCRNCQRNHLDCVWPDRSAKNLAARASGHVDSPTFHWPASARANSPSFIGTPVSQDELPPTLDRRSSSVTSLGQQNEGLPSALPTSSVTSNGPDPPGPPPVSVSKPLRMINVDPRVPAYDLVDKYIRLTAPRLVVYPCPREHNPFIELLFPVAFSHVVAMNSILALAAAHSGSPHSRFLYGAALADLRSALQQDSIGTEVLVATMMLVFFETAEGHSKRQAIQHLQGLARLLKFRRQRGAQTLHDGLAMEVLIYHVVTISIYDNLSQTILKGLRISPTGPTVWSNIGGDLRQSYCLSGLSSEVLDFILEITGLFSPSPEAHTPLPAMLIVEGIALADKINQWQPAIAGDSLFPYALDATNHAELTLAAVLWKNAAFLNLLSLMHGKKISPDDARIAEVVKGSMITLQQIPEHSSVETCLNWPLVMIGSFAISQQDRSLLRRRFNSMEWLIFKNVYIAISILEEAWAQFDEYGTVNLETVMQIPPFDVILS